MAIQPYQKNGYQETVETAFFRDNKVAVPSRITTFNVTGGETQPTIKADYLHTENAGKSPNTTPVYDVYSGNSYNVS